VKAEFAYDRNGNLRSMWGIYRSASHAGHQPHSRIITISGFKAFGPGSTCRAA
jgi:hypothetical protein